MGQSFEKLITGPKLQEILQILREMGFSYPTSDALCDLAHQPQEVRALTNRMIKLIHEFLSRFHTYRPADESHPDDEDKHAKST